MMKAYQGYRIIDTDDCESERERKIRDDDGSSRSSLFSKIRNVIEGDFLESSIIRTIAVRHEYSSMKLWVSIQSGGWRRK
jgi:hypothetical protein